MLLRLDQEEDQLYFKSPVNGTMIKVEAIIKGIDKTNEYLGTHPELGVLYQIADHPNENTWLIFIAKMDDVDNIVEFHQSSFTPSCIKCGRTPLKKTEIASGLLCSVCEKEFISEYVELDI